MDALKVALYDLTKYKIMSKVDTGDKTLDNLYITMILAVIAYFTADKIKIMTMVILHLIRSKFKKEKTTLTAQNSEYYSYTLNKKITRQFTWQWTDEFTSGLATYIKTRYPQKSGSVTTLERWSHVSGDNKTFIERFDPTMDKNAKALYVSNSGIVGIKTEPNVGTLIVSTSSEAEKEFVELVKTFCTPSKVVTTTSTAVDKPRHIHIVDKGSVISQELLYTDRCFSRFISSQKKTILSLLKNFELMNSPQPKTDRQYYGSYNLGIILHGEPGTGKTSIIKCICNELKRDALMVDMRDIRTKDEFKQIFTRYGDMKSFVFVFEEFDCVQGFFDRETVSNKDEIEKLNDKYRTLVTSATKESSPQLVAELDNIKLQIKRLENSLTIDTVLTVLDGVIEHRNRVIIATTNLIDKIDPALIREGRFDLKIKLDRFDNEETHELLSRYFESEDLSYLKDKHFEKQYTPVQMINLCRQYGNLKNVIDYLLYKKID